MIELSKILFTLLVLYCAIIVQSVSIISPVLIQTPDFACAGENDPNRTDVCECKENIVFDQSQWRQTLSSQWRLVCDRLQMRTLPDSFFMGGQAIGSLFGWPLADIFGRKKMAIVSILSIGVILIIQSRMEMPLINTSLSVRQLVTRLIRHDQQHD